MQFTTRPGPINVRALDDFNHSAYKILTDVGVLYGKREYLYLATPIGAASLRAGSVALGNWNSESRAGGAAIDYLAELGCRVSPSVERRRARLVAAMKRSTNTKEMRTVGHWTVADSLA